MLSGYRSVTGFVYNGAGFKSRQGIVCGKFVRLVIGDKMSVGPSRSRRCLEAAIAPATIEIQPLYRCLGDDRAAIHCHVIDAAPMAQHAQPTETGHEGRRAGGSAGQHFHIAALGVAVIAIKVTVKNQPPLVGLDNCEMGSAKTDDGIEDRFDRLGDIGLQDMAFDG